MATRVLEGSPKQVETKSGLAFEVIINEAKCPTPTRLTPHNTPIRNLTNDEIRFKLQKAEERRQSLEMMKLASITEKNHKIEEAAKFREESNQIFSKQAEQKLITKMETNKENKEALLKDLMERLRKTDSKIAQIREINDKETRSLENKIQTKLVTAEEKRLENLNCVIEKMKEHEKHVEEVRKTTQSEKCELEEKILQKLENACVFREQQIEKMKEKLREHDKHVEEVREKVRSKSPNTVDPGCC